MIHGGTTVLFKYNIQYAHVKIPMMSSLQATAIIVELNGLETVIGAFFQSPSNPLDKRL